MFTLYRKWKYESRFALTRFLPRKVLKRGSVIRRLREGRRSSHSYSPQKVRLEDGGERRKTTNRPMRIPAELCSRNQSLEPNILLHLDRNWRLTGTEEKTAFNLSTDTESVLSPTWRIQNFSHLLRTL